MRLIDADAFKEYLKNALEEVKHIYPDGGEFARQITEDFCKDIDEQPTINAEPHWIPCSERMPEEGQAILATIADNAWGDVVILRKFYKTMYKSSVTAWIPLPEPYRGEEE